MSAHTTQPHIDATAHASPPSNGAPPTPLPAIYVFSFLNSMGTGLVTNGVAFIAKQGFGFSRNANFALALVLGITYIVGALFAGRAVAWMRHRGLSSRAVLAGLMVSMALVCALPRFVGWAQGADLPPRWTIWALVVTYSPLSGMIWPMIESFLSGGRSGAPLRSALGTWNIVWSSALIIATWISAPLLGSQPTLALLGLGGVHLVALAVLRRFSREPGVHLHEEHGPTPRNYPPLLAIFRVLLPTCYTVSSALCPMLPDIFARFPVSETWQVRLAATWLVARVVTFFTLERWQRWHGSWAMPAAGAALLLVGFAGAALASRFDTGNAGLAVMVASLFIFGVGMSTIYTGAIYYAMTVGQSEVDAGGTHEALIGVGYTVGPACGLIAGGAIATNVAGDRFFEAIVLVLVAAIALGAIAWGARRSSALRAKGRTTS